MEYFPSCSLLLLFLLLFLLPQVYLFYPLFLPFPLPRQPSSPPSVPLLSVFNLLLRYLPLHLPLRQVPLPSSSLAISPSLRYLRPSLPSSTTFFASLKHLSILQVPRCQGRGSHFSTTSWTSESTSVSTMSKRFRGPSDARSRPPPTRPPAYLTAGVGR